MIHDQPHSWCDTVAQPSPLLCRSLQVSWAVYSAAYDRYKGSGLDIDWTSYYCAEPTYSYDGCYAVSSTPLPACMPARLPACAPLVGSRRCLQESVSLGKPLLAGGTGACIRLLDQASGSQAGTLTLHQGGWL
jgi:hypothetical protein